MDGELEPIANAVGDRALVPRARALLWAEAVLAWFEREPSVRDPDATAWRVRPLIREKLLAYQRLRHPSRFEERARRAAGGAPPAAG